MKNVLNTICIFVLVLLLFESDWNFNWNVISPSKPDMVAVVYESSDNIPEPYVTGALNALSSDGFQVRVFDKDVVTGGGEVPSQVREAISEAVRNGLPALVVLSNGSVVSVQDLPTSKSAILEAVK
jgi:hypothetical protein